MASIITISVHFLLFAVLIGEIHGDWLKEYYAKNRNAAKLLEATTEPLNNVLPYEQVQYSIANISYDYRSSTKFHPRGMAHLYVLTEKFINFIGKDQAFPDGFLEITDENTIHVNDVGKDWPILLNHYGLVLAVVVCVILFATVMPIIGLTFCCCRCVGRCGARSQPFDKRYDPCRRHFYGALLVTVTVLISFGVICAFATNEVLEEGVTNLPKNVRTAFTDTELYINNTKKEINTLLVTNFKELEKTLLNILQASGKIVLDKLTQETNATVLWNLTTIIEGLRMVRNDLRKVNQLTESLHERSSRLNYGLKEIGSRIANDTKQCQKEMACRDFNRRYNANSLSLEANFSRLPNVTAGLQSLSELTSEGIEEEVLKGKVELEKIRAYVQQAVDNKVPLIMENIKKTGGAIETGAQRITKILDNMNSVIAKSINKPIGSGEQMISEFSPYRYYVCFAASCTLLIILICLTFGLLCGCCGSRPNSGYSEDCCNKGTGSRYLMLAVWLMFLSSGVLMAVALIYFVGGIMTDKLICHSLKDPHNSRTFHLLDKLSNIERFYKSEDSIEVEPVNLRSIIRSCHLNLSLYEVLQLEKRIDISEVASYSQKFGIHDRIKELVNNIKLDYDINIITQEAQLLLMKLSQSKLNEISFMNFNNVVSEKITSIDLTQLAKAVEDTANKLPPSYQTTMYSLHNTAMYLETHQKEVVEMVSITKELESTSRQLQEHLKFNHSSLRQAIESLTLKVEMAQENLKRQGRSIVNKLAKEFGNEFTNHIEDYLRKVVTRTEHDIGRCWPISQAYNATVVAGCSRFCLTHLFTHQTFSGKGTYVLGMAYTASSRPYSVGGICSEEYFKNGYTLYLNSGLSSSRNHYGQRVITREADLVTAHEFGHNWGSEHDPDIPECSPSASQGGSYLMYTYSVSGYDVNNKKFSPCSLRSIRKVLQAKSGRCFSEPQESFCGNLRVEKNEECDAGLLGTEDNDNCCNKFCKLRRGHGAVCSDKNSPCCQNCQFMPLNVKCRDAQYPTCEQESRCTGKSADCPPSPPMPDGTTCLERGQCRGGKCIPYCETQGKQSCMCDVVPNSCKRCCRPSMNDTCEPIEPIDILPNGTPCIQGFCNEGVCEKTVQDVVERFWDIIEEININKLLLFLRDNVVGTVILLTALIWIPASFLISYFDKKRLRKEEKRKEWNKREDIMYFPATNDVDYYPRKIIHARIPHRHMGNPSSSSVN